MVRTSLDASVAAALCLCLFLPSAPAQNTLPPKAVTPPARTPPHPPARQTQPAPTQPQHPISARQPVPQTPARTTSPLRPNQPFATGTAITPATPQRGYAGAAAQPSATQPPYATSPGQRIYQFPPTTQRQYQLPPSPNVAASARGTAGTYNTGSTRGAGSAIANRTSGGSPPTNRFYLPPRPVPSYSPAQVRGYQWQAMRGFGPAHNAAALRMGDIYSSPNPGQADPVRAARWYAYSAHLGNVSAAYSLGQLYLLGQGVPSDPARGYALITWAGANGDPDAQAYLASNTQPAPQGPIDDAVPLPPPPPPPPSAPADNTGSDGTDIIADILFGTLAVGVLAAALGSNSSDIPSPAPGSGEHGVSFEACGTVDDLGRKLGYNTSGIDFSVKGCLH